MKASHISHWVECGDIRVWTSSIFRENETWTKQTTGIQWTLQINTLILVFTRHHSPQTTMSNRNQLLIRMEPGIDPNSVL